jgi:glycosyltransferase involved in cell wall biosynthesis
MSSPTPAVAVIIISYNGAAYLPKSIASVLAQTVTDLELVVVEDGSHDGAESIVASFNDPRARYIWRPNGGTSASRNTGIRETTAPLVAFLDCDDWWDPRKLEAQLDALKDSPDADVVYTGAMMVTEGTGAMAIDPAVVVGDATPSLLLRNSSPGSASSVMVRRALIDRAGTFDETLRFAEDWEYWLRLAAKSPFARVEVPHVFISVRPGSFGRNTDALRLAAHGVVNRAHEQAGPQYRRMRRIAHANIEFGASVDLAHHGRRRKAIVPLLRAIRHDPFRWKFWRRLTLLVLTKLWPSRRLRRRIINAT